jgi:hypothetical protein
MADMFQVLILICSAQLRAQDCDRDNAIDVIGGHTAPNEITCMHDAEESLAQTSLVRSGVYPKIMCTRIRMARTPTEATQASLKEPPSREQD